MGLFERSYLLLGMEEALIAYVTEPDLMYDLLGAIADYKIALIARLHEVAHLDMLWYGDDWGTQQAALHAAGSLAAYHPAAHAAHLRLRPRSAASWSTSTPAGSIEAIFGDMVAMGADLWNPCQPCNDLAGLKRQYGDRITFWGGIDSQFVLARPAATPDDVRARGAPAHRRAGRRRRLHRGPEPQCALRPRPAAGDDRRDRDLRSPLLPAPA